MKFVIILFTITQITCSCDSGDFKIIMQ